MSILVWVLIGLVAIICAVIFYFILWRADQDHLNDGYFGDVDDAD